MRVLRSPAIVVAALVEFVAVVLAAVAEAVVVVDARSVASVCRSATSLASGSSLLVVEVAAVPELVDVVPEAAAVESVVSLVPAAVIPFVICINMLARLAAKAAVCDGSIGGDAGVLVPLPSSELSSLVAEFLLVRA